MDLLVSIDVDDLDRAIHFYTCAFELSVGRRFGAGGAELLGGSAPIYLLVKEAGSQATSASSQVRGYGRHWTPVHLDIVVDDVDTAVDRATKAGAALEQAVRSSNWGRLALMSDPFGHEFCLVQFVGSGYDEIATAPREFSHGH